MTAASKIIIAIARFDAKFLNPVASVGWGLEKSEKGLPAPPVASLGTEARAFNSINELPDPIISRITYVDGPIAAVPLWAHAHLKGLILLERNRETGPFLSHILKLLTASGRQLALAVENSQLLSDLQKSYQQLMDTQEGLIRAERLAALGQLSATMAHEIRNPLATIFSAISQIRKITDKTHMSTTLLDIAEEEASRLNTMVKGLLEFARPQKPVFDKDTLLNMVQNTVNRIKETIDLDKLNIKIKIMEPEFKSPLKLDREQVDRALEMLLLNAITALEEKGGIIKINIIPEQSGAAVLISDNGSGITDENISKIFEPFFSTKPSGTGLGLPTVKRIAEDHHGDLKVTSKPGIETTFKMLFWTNRTFNI
jgi:signal transduction histidine kinase